MPEYSQAARCRLPTLSREVKWRLSILEYAKVHWVSATCRRLGIARTTYYYWRKRYDPRDLRTLQTRPSRRWSSGSGRSTQVGQGQARDAARR